VVTLGQLAELLGIRPCSNGILSGAGSDSDGIHEIEVADRSICTTCSLWLGPVGSRRDVSWHAVAGPLTGSMPGEATAGIVANS
jgi:hypothetical protein